MITFSQNNGQFNYRSVGIFLHQDRVLLHRSEKDNFWSLPGGRVEMMETAAETIRREMREELGVQASVDRLLWIVENFYEYDQKKHHELAFYFYLTLPDDSPIYRHRQSFPGRETEVPFLLTFRWFPLNTLNKFEIYPTFLKKSLQALPERPEHIVHIHGQ